MHFSTADAASSDVVLRIVGIAFRLVVLAIVDIFVGGLSLVSILRAHVHQTLTPSTASIYPRTSCSNSPTSSPLAHHCAPNVQYFPGNSSCATRPISRLRSTLSERTRSRSSICSPGRLVAANRCRHCWRGLLLLCDSVTFASVSTTAAPCTRALSPVGKSCCPSYLATFLALDLTNGAITSSHLNRRFPSVPSIGRRWWPIIQVLCATHTSFMHTQPGDTRTSWTRRPRVRVHSIRCVCSWKESYTIAAVASAAGRRTVDVFVGHQQ